MPPASSRLLHCALAVLLAAAPLRADLAEYLALPDASYGWKTVGEQDLGTATFHDLRLTSQRWQGRAWEHNLYLFVPKTAPGSQSDPRPGSALLIIEGGSQKALDKAPSPTHLLYGALLAGKLGIPCALLRQVPNQPLYNNLKEDWLVAHTFEKYVETGDETWPLLFPMTKAAIRAMDAVGEFSAATRDPGLPARLDRFIVMGASKRGWTTWLTAASDARVTALIPVVIDMLNTPAQARHQKEVLGHWSEATAPYHPLLNREPTPRTEKLWSMVDPYTFREKVTQPKLLILGNNDPFWSTDSLNLYWNDLPAPKWVSYVPNAGHNLSPPGGKKNPPIELLDHVAAFVRTHTRPHATPLPTLGWKTATGDDGSLQITATASAVPTRARLWQAASATHDFRQAHWSDSPAAITPAGHDGATVTAAVPPPKDGALACYVTMEFDIDGLPCRLSTQLNIVDGQKRIFPNAQGQ